MVPTGAARGQAFCMYPDILSRNGLIAAYLSRLRGIREYHLPGPPGTPGAAGWRTEIGWPISGT